MWHLSSILFACLALIVNFFQVGSNLENVKWVTRKDNPSMSAGMESESLTYVPGTEFNAGAIPGKQVGNKQEIFQGVEISELEKRSEHLVSPYYVLERKHAKKDGDVLPESTSEGRRTKIGTFQKDDEDNEDNFDGLDEEKGVPWWHILLYVLASIFGIVVIIFLCIQGKLYKAFKVCLLLVNCWDDD